MDRKLGVVSFIASLVVAFMSIRSAAGQVGSETVSPSQIKEEPLYVLLEKSTLPSPDGVHSVFRVADANSTLAQEAARLLEQSYAQQALVLYQSVKNYLAHQLGGDPATAAQPTYVFLGNGGGYADLGFWLEDARGQLVDKRATSYVGGVTIGEGYLGDFEQIFPHELGHVMLQELAGWQQGTLVTQIHQATMTTDYVYAFNEGWGEHFQAVAVDHTTNADLQAQANQPLLVGEQGPYARLARELKGRCLLCPAKLSLLLWFSQRESHLRYAGVKSDLFAHQPAIPEELLRRRDQYDALLYQAIVPPDSSDSLKNGSQMLASEGLTAALFYRIVNDPHLQQTYREPAFYEGFLPPGKVVDWVQTSPGELFSPMENAYLKLFHVLARHVHLDRDLLGESPTIQMVRGYATDYPDEAEVVYDVFLEITQGVTVEPEAFQRVQDWAAGRLSTTDHQAYLEDLHRRLLAGQVNVDSALGPQIWLRNPDVQVGIGVMDVHRSLPRPYHFNLNAATVVDLRTVPGVEVELARRIVRVRDEQGGFNTLEELAEVPGMTSEIIERFRGMQRAMQAWLDQGISNAEDELSMGTLIGTLIRSLLQRLLVGLALTSVVAGLILAAGRFLQAASARRLGLEVRSVGQDRAPGKVRRTIGRVGWLFLMVVLPVTLFLLLQVLLLASNGGQVPGVGFAIAIWLFGILPYLGWRVVRRRLNGRAALHCAAWALVVYVAMFGVVGWLMGT